MTKKKVLYRLLLLFLNLGLLLSQILIFVGGLYEVRGARPMTQAEWECYVYECDVLHLWEDPMSSNKDDDINPICPYCGMTHDSTILIHGPAFDHSMTSEHFSGMDDSLSAFPDNDLCQMS